MSGRGSSPYVKRKYLDSSIAWNFPRGVVVNVIQFKKGTAWELIVAQTAKTELQRPATVLEKPMAGWGSSPYV